MVRRNSASPDRQLMGRPHGKLLAPAEPEDDQRNRIPSRRYGQPFNRTLAIFAALLASHPAANYGSASQTCPLAEDWAVVRRKLAARCRCPEGFASRQGRMF